MHHEQFVEEVQRRAGLGSEEDAERVVYVTVRALGERLDTDEATALAGKLPAQLGARLRMAQYERDFDVDELYARVARREGVAPGFGAEHAQTVCQVLGEAMGPELRRRFALHLGPDFGALFEPRFVTSPPPRPVHIDPEVTAGEGVTLASGRPGSRQPVSSSAADRAHSESVARSDDPHGDTKLSSSRGLTQQRQGDSMAEGRPGPKHPMSATRR